ncbi:MAG: DUF2239 family protein [Phenylobacterium sp.]
MSDAPDHNCTAFDGQRRIASGPLAEVAVAARRATGDGSKGPVLIFDDATGHVVDVDLRGGEDEVRRRLTPPPLRGRPKLGVVPREVTLLPRHWDWLASQPGGASVALRKLVEEARRTHAKRDRIRQAQDAAYRFISAMAGDLPGFEEASRALFAGNAERFYEETARWPADVREHARQLAFEGRGGER